MPTSTSRRPADRTGRRLAAAVLVGTVGQLLVAVLLPGVARAEVRPRWAPGLLVAGAGAVLAVGWELAEWHSGERGGGARSRIEELGR